MKGDVLIIGDHHKKAAQQSVRIMLDDILEADGKYVITVAGESGAGKSEIAASIADMLESEGIKTFIFQQDDYFVYPPKTNAEVRKQDIHHVGTGEVKLGLMDEEISAILSGVEEIEKPLVIFDEDRISSEVIDFSPFKVLIAEGTYTTALKHANCRIFIDRNLDDTRAARSERAREKQDEFLEKILTIEHNIISKHKEKADIIITKEYIAVRKEDHGS